jgi:hypothetical protein
MDPISRVVPGSRKAGISGRPINERSLSFNLFDYRVEHSMHMVAGD